MAKCSKCRRNIPKGHRIFKLTETAANETPRTKDETLCERCAREALAPPVHWFATPAYRRNVCEAIIRMFDIRGSSTHSARGKTLPLIIRHCEVLNIPYLLMATPGVGYYIKNMQTMEQQSKAMDLIEGATKQKGRASKQTPHKKAHRKKAAAK